MLRWSQMVLKSLKEIYQQGLNMFESNWINLFWEAQERLSCPNSLPSSWHHQGEAQVLSAKSWGHVLLAYATSSHPQSPSMTFEAAVKEGEIDGWWVPPASPDCKVRLAAATKVYCIVRGQDSPVAWLPQIWLYMTTRLPYSIMVFNQWLMEFPGITGSIVSLSSQRHELWNFSCTGMCAGFFCFAFCVPCLTIRMFGCLCCTIRDLLWHVR